jgi:amidase
VAAQVHAFDDELGGLDGLATAALIRDRQVSRREVIESALRRAAAVDAELNLVAVLDEGAVEAGVVAGPFSGVPTFIKDNTDVAGLPSHHGSEGLHPKPASHDAAVTTALRRSGAVVLGKSRLPEFGFNASTEFATEPPARNPWDPDYSTGASSGGSAGLVAAGAVPFAHANDGGGSIRIPAAACGLVGLKCTRGRMPAAVLEHVLPVNIVGEGVVSRSVRDTAHLLAHIERRVRGLPKVGLVEGPGTRRLRIGLVLDSVTGTPTDDATRAAVCETAALLGELGHDVREMAVPVDAAFADDFTLYWSGLAAMMAGLGHRLLPGLDRSRLDGLTRGLAGHFRAHRRDIVGAVARLRRSSALYEEALAGFDAVLTPVTAGTTPRLGYLSPTLPFEELLDRLAAHVAFTPVNNASGSPAISVPTGRTPDGRPVGVHVMGPRGGERTLLELAYELEQARPFTRLGTPSEAAAATAG